MRDYLELGSAPADENCVQVSSKNDYIMAMREECKKYKAQLEQMFPDRPEGCYFGIKTFSHDFGNYYEVVVYFDDENEEQSNFAFELEGKLPEKWED